MDRCEIVCLVGNDDDDDDDDDDYNYNIIDDYIDDINDDINKVRVFFSRRSETDYGMVLHKGHACFLIYQSEI